mmetsp:Transcript_8530/g.7648  ORF Transcript_8530/g.7648 Transcript_8530/m.7648 type:complete len:204 (-) Transcript_8530:27-638(-)
METLSGFNKVMRDLSGRDKINTLIQECAKLTWFVLNNNKQSPELAAQCLALGKGLSLCRSADRFLNATIPLEGFLKIAGSDDVIFIKLPRMLIAFGYIIFFYYDNKIFLGMLGVLKNLDYADLGGKACKLWFYCLCLTLLLQILKMRSDKEKDEETQLSFYGNCCDVMVAANGSGYLGGSPPIFHILTIISAIIGIKKLRLKK